MGKPDNRRHLNTIVTSCPHCFNTLKNEMRAAQAIEAGARTIITPYPYCLQMLEDGITSASVEEPMRVMGIAEMVEMSII
jgi:Fe-S oxidoreductase